MDVAGNKECDPMNWTKLVERERDFLKNHLLYEALEEEFPKAFGINHCDFLTTRQGYRFTHYFDEKTWKEVADFLEKQVKINPGFIRECIEKGKKHFNSLLCFCEEINKKINKINAEELKKLSNKELKNIIEKYFFLYKQPYPYFNLVVFINGLQENKEIAEQMAEWRYFGRNSFNKAHELTENLFEEIGKRFGCSAGEIKYLRPEEIIMLLQGILLDIKKIIQNRQNCCLILQNGKFELIENKKFEFNNELENKESEKTKEQSAEIKEIKGAVTFSAKENKENKKIIGNVVIINSKKDFEKIKKENSGNILGNIIVARMLTPLIMADIIAESSQKIRQISAIITDEGGITCHAALISREFRIPAIIGTRNATKLLKDGDVVELDIKKGAVNIK